MAQPRGMTAKCCEGDEGAVADHAVAAGVAGSDSLLLPKANSLQPELGLDVPKLFFEPSLVVEQPLDAVLDLFLVSDQRSAPSRRWSPSSTTSVGRRASHGIDWMRILDRDTALSNRRFATPRRASSTSCEQRAWAEPTAAVADVCRLFLEVSAQR